MLGRIRALLNLVRIFFAQAITRSDLLDLALIASEDAFEAASEGSRRRLALVLWLLDSDPVPFC